MKRIWIYLINTFLVCTETSYRMAVRISTKHDAALQAAAAGLDAFFVAMYAAYHPIHLALVAAYDAWVAQGGTQESKTLTLNQLLRLLSGTYAETWMSAVKQFYGLNTARFKELFPDMKKVFQHGSQLDRIHAVAALLLAIGSDASLATLKATILTFYNQLLLANTTQKGSISVTNTLSHNLEEARKTSCVEQFGNYGGLIQKFKTTPETVGNYFDERALRGGNQVLWHHSVAKTKVYTVCKHTSAPTDEWLLENDGDTALDFGFVLNKGDNPGLVFVRVAAHANVTVHASDLTNDLTHNHYLVAKNNDLLVDGEFTAEIL